MWRRGEAARRREEERARRAEDDRIAAERHEQSLGETRRQTTLTRVGVWVAVAALVAGVAGVAVPLVGRGGADPPAPAAPTARPSGTDPVTASAVSLWHGSGTSYFVPKSPGRLGTPPDFTPEPEGMQEFHCAEWKGWFAQQRAAPAGGTVFVEVAATLAAPVTVVDVDARPVTRTLGSEAEPLRHYHLGREITGPSYDWSPARQEWFVV